MNSGAPLWCVRPLPAENELLSSWLHRLALANAISDHTLCRHMFGDAPIWNRDIDRCVPDHLLPTLSRWTGVAVGRLEEMKLAHFLGKMTARFARVGNCPWLLPLGVYHRIRLRRGLQFCPACLRSGPADALWVWRLAWATACPVHHTDLLEGCPSCGSPYIPHRMAPSLFGRACCPHCGFDVARAAAADAEEPAVEFERRLAVAAANGTLEFCGRQEAAVDVFDGLRRLARVVLQERSAVLNERILKDAINPDRFSDGHAVLEFQRLSVRKKVFRVLRELLSDWPHTFAELIRDGGLPRYAFDHEGRRLPFWVQFGLARVFLARPRRLSAREVFGMCQWLRVGKESVTSKEVALAFGMDAWCFDQPVFLRTISRFRHRRAHRQ